jgi:hypothetical protein
MPGRGSNAQITFVVDVRRKPKHSTMPDIAALRRWPFWAYCATLLKDIPFHLSILAVFLAVQLRLNYSLNLSI